MGTMTWNMSRTRYGPDLCAVAKSESSMRALQSCVREIVEGSLPLTLWPEEMAQSGIIL